VPASVRSHSEFTRQKRLVTQTETHTVMHTSNRVTAVQHQSNTPRSDLPWKHILGQTRVKADVRDLCTR